LVLKERLKTNTQSIARHRAVATYLLVVTADVSP